MQSREYWRDKIDTGARELGFKDGYGLLYGPWAILDQAKIAFVSLNPGGGGEGDSERSVDYERGNSYEDTESQWAISSQFMRMCRDVLQVRATDILTGVAVPYRSRNWNALTSDQKLEGELIGRQFWGEALGHRRRDLVVTCSTLATSMIVRATNATLDSEIPAKWGKAMLRRYVSNDGAIIVALPHLSRFKLFSREQCKSALHDIFEIAPRQFNIK